MNNNGDQWISVDEHLPRTDKHCLVIACYYDKNNIFRINIKSAYFCKVALGNGIWGIDSVGSCQAQPKSKQKQYILVTHWMRLPKLPKCFNRKGNSEYYKKLKNKLIVD